MPLFSSPRASPLKKRFPLGSEQRIAWVGDSITHACRWTRLLEDYLFCRYPKQKISFWNAGIAGDKAGDVLRRFDTDIAAFEPTLALVMLGMNDGAVRDWDDAIFAVFQRDTKALVGGLEKLTGSARSVLILSPTPFDEIARASYRKGRPVPHYDQVLGRYGDWLRKLAGPRRFVDTQASLRAKIREWRLAGESPPLLGDGIHPSPLGSAFISLEVLRSQWVPGKPPVFMAPPIRASLSVDLAARGKIEASAVDVTLADRENGVFRIRARARSLPWVLSEDTRKLVLYSYLYRNLNSFRLRVSGLPAGSYWLEIDGKKTVLCASGEWAEGVDMSLIPSHPDYLAAAKITKLNYERNRLIRTGIRDLLHTPILIRYFEKRDPERAEGYRKKLKRLEAEHQGVVKRIAQLRAEIETLRRPALVEYRLVRYD
ncbi:MAG: hypothetical protein CSA62_05365 [Planctomycetota bacterium]|nr:MAG: hypothetical protein CSA62_05365 [Planctomycetota bacterium]